MFDYDDAVADSLLHPQRLWAQLDSFWRDRTADDTRGLVLFETYAQLISSLSNSTLSAYYISQQTTPEAQDYRRAPFWPLIIFRSHLQERSFYLYGDGELYNDPPDILYGEQGVARYVFALPGEVVSIGSLIDSITGTSVVIDPSQFSFSRQERRLTFAVDPFTLITPHTDSRSGEEYVVLWMRNALFDLRAPYEWLGWTLKFFDNSEEHYTASLKSIWELVYLGASLGRLQRGLLAACGLPYSVEDELVDAVDVDPAQTTIITPHHAYSAPGVPPIVALGDRIPVGAPLVGGVRFFDYSGLQTASSADVPGVVFRVLLSTGVVADISAKNDLTEWSYDAGRPSPWRFPLGGLAEHIEQFWEDSAAFALANGIDLAVVYGLSLPGPNPINPLLRLAEDLLQNNLFVISASLDTLPTAPGGFYDRAMQLMPLSTMITLLQLLPGISDVYELGAETSDSVGYGYHEDVPTEVISVSGTDLTFFDYTPLVVLG